LHFHPTRESSSLSNRRPALPHFQRSRLARVSLPSADSSRSQQAVALPRPMNSSHSAPKNFLVLQPLEPACSAPPPHPVARLLAAHSAQAAESSAPFFSAAKADNYQEPDSPAADP
jgi:hypothetical protein